MNWERGGCGRALGRGRTSVIPACAGMTEKARGDDGGGMAWAIGGVGERLVDARTSHPPPNLPPGRGEG